jgi:Mor family transcriptional regulator
MGWKYQYDISIFEKIETEDQAYWLGFLYADGCVGYNKFSLALQFGDRQQIDRMISFLGSSNIVRDYLKPNTQFLQSSTTITNKKISDDLKKLGCVENKTFKIKFPTIDIVPEHLRRDFLRGHSDGDGCFYVNPILHRASYNYVSNYEFCEESQLWLMEQCGLSKTKMGHNKTKTCWRVEYGGWEQVSKIHHFLYDGAQTFLPRKMIKIFDLDIFLRKKNNLPCDDLVAGKQEMLRKFHCDFEFRNLQFAYRNGLISLDDLMDDQRFKFIDPNHPEWEALDTEEIGMIIDDYENGIVIRKIAEKFNIDNSTVKKVLIRKNIPRTRAKAITIPGNKIENIVVDYQNGMKCQEILGKYHISKTSLRRILQKSSVPTHHSKYKVLSQELIDAVTADYQNGVKRKNIAKKFDLDPGTVTRIVRKNGVQLRSPFAKDN